MIEMDSLNDDCLQTIFEYLDDIPSIIVLSGISKRMNRNYHEFLRCNPNTRVVAGHAIGNGNLDWLSRATPEFLNDNLDYLSECIGNSGRIEFLEPMCQIVTDRNRVRSETILSLSRNGYYQELREHGLLSIDKQFARVSEDTSEAEKEMIRNDIVIIEGCKEQCLRIALKQNSTEGLEFLISIRLNISNYLDLIKGYIERKEFSDQMIGVFLFNHDCQTCSNGSFGIVGSVSCFQNYIIDWLFRISKRGIELLDKWVDRWTTRMMALIARIAVTCNKFDIMKWVFVEFKNRYPDRLKQTLQLFQTNIPYRHFLIYPTNLNWIVNNTEISRIFLATGLIMEARNNPRHRAIVIKYIKDYIENTASMTLYAASKGWECMEFLKEMVEAEFDIDPIACYKIVPRGSDRTRNWLFNNYDDITAETCF